MEKGALNDNTFNFSDYDIRKGFVTKVLSIVGIQLLISGLISLPFILNQEVQNFVRLHQGLYIASYFVFLISYIILVCFKTRNVMANVVLMTILTLSLSLFVGCVASYHKAESIVIAFFALVAVVAGLFILAKCDKIDFTTTKAYLITLVFSLFIVAILLIFCFVYVKSNTIVNIISGLLVIFYMMSITRNLQLIMGQHKYSFSPDDYVYASVTLYSDIIFLFLNLLTLSR